MVSSMTGFARQEAAHAWGTLSWELRSVNQRYLEPHFRLPELFRAIEPELRNRLRNNLHRGKVEVSLNLQWDVSREDSLAIDKPLVERLTGAVDEINQQLKDPAAVSALDILRWPGVVNTESADREALHKAALALFDQAVQQLQEHRAREGKELAALIEQRLEAIGKEVAVVRQGLPGILQNQRDKLTERLTAIKEDINQDRLEQELVIYAQKADVAEELERLETHVTEVRRALKAKGPIGRRLDFLMQELNREANTLSSKSIAGETTQAAIELKLLIEQMREQIQNIE